MAYMPIPNSNADTTPFPASLWQRDDFTGEHGHDHARVEINHSVLMGYTPFHHSSSARPASITDGVCCMALGKSRHSSASSDG